MAPSWPQQACSSLPHVTLDSGPLRLKLDFLSESQAEKRREEQQKQLDEACQQQQTFVDDDAKLQPSGFYSYDQVRHQRGFG